MKEIRTIDELYEAFDGLTATSQAFGYVHASGAAWWRARGIPPSMRLPVIIRAKARGFRVAGELLGLSEDECRALYDVDAQPQKCKRAS